MDTGIFWLRSQTTVWVGWFACIWWRIFILLVIRKRWWHRWLSYVFCDTGVFRWGEGAHQLDGSLLMITEIILAVSDNRSKRALYHHNHCYVYAEIVWMLEWYNNSDYQQINLKPLKPPFFIFIHFKTPIHCHLATCFFCNPINNSNPSNLFFPFFMHRAFDGLVNPHVYKLTQVYAYGRDVGHLNPHCLDLIYNGFHPMHLICIKYLKWWLHGWIICIANILQRLEHNDSSFINCCLVHPCSGRCSFWHQRNSHVCELKCVNVAYLWR